MLHRLTDIKLIKMEENSIKHGVNLADVKWWWERCAGEDKGGQFNKDLYLKFLEYYNTMTFEERSKKH